MPEMMQLDVLADALRKRLEKPLPGADAHNQMRAIPTGSLKPKFEFKGPPRPGSVLILFYTDNGAIKFPMIKRPEYEGAHSGQVSLPGGKAEANEDYITTALREGEEEIGIDRTSIQIIGKLSNFFVIPSNFMVVPVVGITYSPPVFKPDPVEVVRVLEASLSSILEEEAIRSKEIIAANRFPMIAPHFEIDGEVVWGATAMMLNELRIVVRELDVDF